MTLDETPESSDEFVTDVRQYILDTLSPLIPTGEQTGRFMYGLLRRALRSATREDLEQVVLHCVAFTDGLRAKGFITEELARQAAEFLTPGVIPDALATDTDTGLLYDANGAVIEDLRDPDFNPITTNRPALPGQGASDRTDEEWQEHTGQAPYSGLSPDNDEGAEERLEPSTDTGGGHQAEVEGNTDTDREESGEAVPQDGAG